MALRLAQKEFYLYSWLDTVAESCSNLSMCTACQSVFCFEPEALAVKAMLENNELITLTC